MESFDGIGVDPILAGRLWQPDVEIRQVAFMGARWPTLIAYLFETNELGERRFVGSRSYDLNIEQEVRSGNEDQE